MHHVIADNSKKNEIQKSWNTVEELRKFDSFVPIMPDGSALSASSLMPEPYWNFPFFLAYAVLDDTLEILQSEGVFNSGSWKLSLKMRASQSTLPWQDYQLVDAGREARNDLAHEAKFLSKKECFKYVRAVENELKAWNIL